MLGMLILVIFRLPTKPINFSNAPRFVYVPLFFLSPCTHVRAVHDPRRVSKSPNTPPPPPPAPPTSHSRLTINFQRSMKNAIRIRCRCPSFPVEHILYPNTFMRNEAGPSMNSEAVKPCYYYYCTYSLDDNLIIIL